jgi:hypothetical protein
MDEVPERGPALREDRMLVPFDVDCGYLLDGHRFIARGLLDQGMLSRPDLERDPSVPGFSLEYELVPGVPPTDGPPFPNLVGITYQADVPLPWEPNDGGAIAPFEGGPSTHGSRGSWPLPRTAGLLRFALTGIDASTGWERSQPDGVLTVDLHDGSARWEPGISR